VRPRLPGRGTKIHCQKRKAEEPEEATPFPIRCVQLKCGSTGALAQIHGASRQMRSQRVTLGATFQRHGGNESDAAKQDGNPRASEPLPRPDRYHRDKAARSHTVLCFVFDVWRLALSRPHGRWLLLSRFYPDAPAAGRTSNAKRQTLNAKRSYRPSPAISLVIAKPSSSALAVE